MDIKFIYRISDGGNPKLKLGNATKMHCLDNFISEFGNNIYVFADNCKEETVAEIRKRGIEPMATSLGNSASWRYVVQYAIDHFSEDSFVYLIEDDYLHLPGSLPALIEGLALADYVTLYDHPDKYINFDDEGGCNPYISEHSERTRVLLSKTTHWKHTNSTTMSFATRVKTLKEDKEIWWYFTQTKIPDDFFAFQILTAQNLLYSRKFYRKSISLWPLRRKLKKKRVLISSLPGFATHAALASVAQLTKWQNIQSWEDI